MDEFTTQCLLQNNADFKAGRISKDAYMNALMSIYNYKSGGYINGKDYIVYPNCSPKADIVFSSDDEADEEDHE
jgi:hypothetical protein